MRTSSAAVTSSLFVVWCPGLYNMCHLIHGSFSGNPAGLQKEHILSTPAVALRKSVKITSLKIFFTFPSKAVVPNQSPVTLFEVSPTSLVALLMSQSYHRHFIRHRENCTCVDGTQEKGKKWNKAWSFQTSPKEQSQGINKILDQIYLMQRLCVVFTSNQNKIISNKRSRDNLMVGLLLTVFWYLLFPPFQHIRV